MKIRNLLPFILLLTACATPDGGYPGSYQANPANEPAVILTLERNGAAVLLQDVNGPMPYSAEGDWLGSEDSLDVTFDGGAVLTFGRGDDDSLILVDDLTGMAPAGLALYPTTPLIGTWVWLQTTANGQVTDPSTADAFTLTFNPLGYANMTTDCNSGQGAFLVGAGQQLSMPVIATTRMFCEGSNEGDYYAQLGLVESYTITADGVLELHLGGDGGTMEFSPEA